MASKYMVRTAQNLLKQVWYGHNPDHELARVGELIDQAIESSVPYMDLDEGEGYELLNSIRSARNRARKENDMEQVKVFNDLFARFELATHLYEGVSDDILGMAIEKYHSMRLNAYAQYIESMRSAANTR